MTGDFRIAKRQWRKQRTGEVQTYFVVQRLEPSWWWLINKKDVWEDCREYSGGGYQRIIEFETLEDAQKYIRNRIKPLVEEEIVEVLAQDVGGKV